MNDVDASIKLFNQRAVVANALGLSLPALDEIIDGYRRGSRDVPNSCAFTTQQGTACSYLAGREVGHYLWACQHHHDQLVDTIPYLIEHAPAGVLAEFAESLWRRMEGDEWAREVCNRHLKDCFDRLLDDRLRAKWGAAS